MKSRKLRSLNSITGKLTLALILILGLSLSVVFADGSYPDEDLPEDQLEELIDLDGLVDDDDAIAELEAMGITEEGDILTNRNGVEMQPLESGESVSQNSSGISDDGVTTTEDLDLETLADEPLEADNCTWWWVHGKHGWKYKSFLNYYVGGFGAGTWTTYGTKTKSCNKPLVCNRLFLKAEILGGKWSKYNCTKTGYNTYVISIKKKREGWGLGKICGMRVFHEAQKGSTKWHVISRSGCAK